MPSTRRPLATEEYERSGRDARFRKLCRAVLADTLADFEGLWRESRSSARPTTAPTTRNGRALRARAILRAGPAPARRSSAAERPGCL